MPLPSDSDLAIHLASSAGSLLRAIQSSAARSELGSQVLKDRGDRLAQEHLALRLTAMRPNDAVLSEEASDDVSRLSADRVWIIDPLDGTREFSEGRHDWAVHVALWEHGNLTVGAVALPGIGLVLSTADAAKNWERPKKVRLAASRSRPGVIAEALADALSAERSPMGSAGYKVGAVVRGEVDAYVHSGGQYEWDSAAPVAVARTAGLYTSRVDGSVLTYNRPNPYLPDLVVCNPTIARDIMEILASLTAS